MREIVYNYKTKHKYGFTHKEIEDVLKGFPNINLDKFYEALQGNTCMVIGNEVITYHCDLLLALECGVENRDVESHEWD